MPRNPTPRGKAWTWVGLALAAGHLTWLSTIGLVDHGQLAADRLETLPWLLLVAVPGVLGAVGLRKPDALKWAAAVSFPLALVSLGGATLPLILPAMFYVVAYAKSARVTGGVNELRS